LFFENVAGLKSAAKKHLPFYERINRDSKELHEDYKLGSLFQEILKEFRTTGYAISWKILNAADYGVPQKRKRLILIGSTTIDPEIIFREIEDKAEWADPKIAEELGKKPWKTLRHAFEGLEDEEKEFKNFPRWGKFLKHVPPGGCWIHLPKHLQRKAMGGAADTNDPLRKGKQGGRRGFFRRLSWDSPAPTLVTSPTQMGTCICHPDEDRALTVKEYSRIQGFPDNWNLVGSISDKYRMIGEAVPIQFANVIGKVIYKHLN